MTPEEWHAWFSVQAGWTRQTRVWLYDQAGLAQTSASLEVGCGTGIIARELARELTEDTEVLSLLARPQSLRNPLAESFAVEQVGSIVRPRIGKGGRAYLVNEKGHLLYHSGAGSIGDDVSDQPAVRTFLAGDAGVVRTHNALGQEIVASVAPVPGTDWGLITEESWDELIRSGQGYRQLLLLLLALGVMAPVAGRRRGRSVG